MNVRQMTRFIVEAIQSQNPEVQRAAERLIGDLLLAAWEPNAPEGIRSLLLRIADLGEHYNHDPKGE